MSVVVPTYNRERTLPRALDSVLAQTYADFEVLVVDDGSTDQTAALAAEYEARDERVRYLRQSQNAGVSAARNRGLREARGEFVAFLDSDDEWRPEKLDRQIRRFRELPARVGLLYSGVEDVGPGGHRTVRVPAHRGDLHRTLLERNVIHGLSGVVLRRAAVEHAGLFDEGIPAIEDYEYWLRVTDRFEADFVPAPLVRYHDADDSGRKSLNTRDNLEARAYLYRVHGAAMRREGVAHHYLLQSARRHRAAGDRAGTRRAALQALRTRPTERAAYHALAWATAPPALWRSARRAVRVVAGAGPRAAPTAGGTTSVAQLLQGGAGRSASSSPPAPPSQDVMRVTLFSPTPRDGPRGGAEGVFEALAEGLAVRGHDVSRVHNWSNAGQERTVSGTVWTVPTVSIAGLPTWHGIPRPGAAARVLTSTRRLAQCFRALRPDVVNVHFVDAAAAYVLALRPLVGYRVVLTAHGSDVLRPRHAVNRTLLPHLLRRADVVVAVSGHVGERVLELAPSARVTVVQNGVDLSFWRGGAGRDPEPGRIVQVGTLRYVKGQDVMIEALARLRDRVPEARLDLVGDGSARADLEAHARRLGVADAVTFVGRIEPEDVRERLRSAAVLVLPSRSEGMPLTLLEAMSAGVPVVATTVGGIPEVAGEPPCVSLVSPEDPVALADALAHVLADGDTARDLRVRGQARSKAFSWDRTLGAYEALFADIIGRAGPNRTDFQR